MGQNQSQNGIKSIGKWDWFYGFYSIWLYNLIKFCDRFYSYNMK